ncbi:MAG: YihY/virulence factor BrkB family protein [Bacteroidales bacterium]|nr:YihY/virulence factor BrkB family protein [Bacteroidales bacterium]
MFKGLFHRIAVIIRWISIRISRILRFITHDIWFLNEEDFSRWKARLVKDAKTVILMLNTFSDQKIGYQVTALAYRSMLAVVPAIAIGLYLTDSVGLRDRFAEILQANLGEERIINALLNAADTIVNTAESGLFGFISMASFLWIVVLLMITVRRVFNNVWRVDREQKFLPMIGVVISIMVLAPFVVIIFFTGSVVYSNILDYVVPSGLFLSDSFKTFLSWLLFAAVVVLVMSAMFKYIPGTKVHYKHALKAAVIAGLVFTGVQYLYLETQVLVNKQNTVYGVLAAVPLFMIWLNMGWSIILYGAELTYSFQNVDSHRLTIENLDVLNEQAIRKRKERIQNSMKI